MSDQDFTKLKVAELREMLKLKGLNAVGNKQELIERLQVSMSESSGELNEDDLLNDDELEEEKSLLDSTNDEILKSPSESTKSTSPEVVSAPAKKVSLKRNISISIPIIETKSAEDSPAEASDGASGEPDKKVVKISELTAKDRLELRAKKFSGGVEAPPQDRLQARAARFGSTLTTDKSVAAKPAAVTSSVSLEVLKKRAERFGTLVPELKKVEIEEKLNKRQERFGASEKVPITAPTTTTASDSDYKEKALKRLERFKQAA